MRTISQRELKEILDKHKKWLNNEDGGKRAELRYVYLQGFDLRHANLRNADLQGADLRHTNLRHANLERAILQGSDLSNADLSYADLWRADLSEANLQNTKLLKTILYNANVKHVERRWFVSADHIGSRKAETLYFIDADTVLCGCWRGYGGGTLDEFKARINEVYSADSKDRFCQQYRIEYLSAIRMFELMREAYLKKCNGEGKSSERNIDWGIE
jgi:uncharacterized protein YjbI with pentapeptide repeats